MINFTCCFLSRNDSLPNGLDLSRTDSNSSRTRFSALKGYTMHSIRHAAFALALVVFAFALSANGATVFEQNVVNGSNYELTEAGNWSSSLPTLTNLGTIGLDSTEAAAVVLTSWNITQTAGRVSLGDLTLSGGSIFTIAGGNTVVDSYTADTSYINFTANSTGTLTILGNTAKSDFENLYISGAILYNGSNAGGFDSNFAYNGESSISAIPEPATMSLLALGGIAMLRRRKK